MAMTLISKLAEDLSKKAIPQKDFNQYRAEY